MNAGGEDRPEGRLKRWSRRKSQGRDAAPEPETPEKPQKRGAAAPVADRGIVPPMPPLAEPEEGEIAMEAAPPEALAIKEQLEAEKAAREEEEQEVEEEERELTPEEAEAVAKLPPLKSLDKDSDFTPFFAENVPDFLKRQAYKVLWRSNPYFNIRDGLDDYDEDFSLAKLVGNVISETKGKTKPAKTAKTAAPKKGVPVDNKDADADAAEVGGEDDDLGDGEDEDGGEDGEEIAAEDAESDENPSESS